VTQVVHPVAREAKRSLLSHLILQGDWQQVLIFTRTKHGANRLAEQLGRDGITAAAIHGNKSQGARTRALADFKSGALRALVATDIAARGLDIDRLPHVVNFELPNVPEDYVHRIGRTGRAGSDGTAVSLISPDERGLLAGIERLLGRRIDVQRIDGFEERGSTDETLQADARRQSQAPRKHHARPRSDGRGEQSGNRAQTQHPRSHARKSGRGGSSRPRATV